MDAAEELRRFYEALTERQWSEAESSPVGAPDARLHIPGIGLEATSWQEGLAGVRAFVEGVDAHYVVDDVVEHGPLVVVFLTATGTIDGRLSTWSLCGVHRMDDGKNVETWVLRGSEPTPVDA